MLLDIERRANAVRTEISLAEIRMPDFAEIAPALRGKERQRERKDARLAADRVRRLELADLGFGPCR